eukprot:4686650-Prymnesium_polylepis.1
MDELEETAERETEDGDMGAGSAMIIEMLLVRKIVMIDGRRHYVWVSTDGQTCIEPRRMLGGATFWLLTFYQMAIQYALHSILPVNSARKY